MLIVMLFACVLFSAALLYVAGMGVQAHSSQAVRQLADDAALAAAGKKAEVLNLIGHLAIAQAVLQPYAELAGSQDPAKPTSQGLSGARAFFAGTSLAPNAGHDEVRESNPRGASAAEVAALQALVSALSAASQAWYQAGPAMAEAAAVAVTEEPVPGCRRVQSAAFPLPDAGGLCTGLSLRFGPSSADRFAGPRLGDDFLQRRFSRGMALCQRQQPPQSLPESGDQNGSQGNRGGPAPTATFLGKGCAEYYSRSSPDEPSLFQADFRARLIPCEFVPASGTSEALREVQSCGGSSAPAASEMQRQFADELRRGAGPHWLF